jgi:polyhydroxyalkanoate synthesis regulator phasin
MKKILLLDIENLHKTESEILKYLTQYQYIYLVYAKSPVGFSLDGVVKLAPFIMSGKLKTLKMPKVGKEAADFGITFIAGQLSTQFKTGEVTFDVMSNDHSMEYVVDLFKIAKFEAKIISEKPLVAPHVAQQIKLEIDIQKFIQEYCLNLNRENFTKPAKVETLINSIRVNLKVEEDIAKLLVDELIKAKIIKINNIKIQYSSSAIAKIISKMVVSTETADNDLERKLTNLRLRLMPFLNVAPEKRPKYVASFEVILEKCLPKEQVSEALQLLIKYQLITLNKREIIYSPQLLGN